MTRAPSDPDRRREQARDRQREKRKRDRNDITSFPGRASAAFIEAMKARARFFGATKDEAECDADDRKKIAALVFEIIDAWAPNWYSKK
jgi:hypothetical protein